MHGTPHTGVANEINASVLLLAAASEQKKALAAKADGDLPPFTDALIASLGIASDYMDLRSEIERRVLKKGNPSPVLNDDLARSAAGVAFRSQRPFAI